MGSLKRQIQRQKMKANGTLIYKKKLAKKLGISVAEFNRRIKRREVNLEEITGGNDYGKE